MSRERLLYEAIEHGRRVAPAERDKATQAAGLQRAREEYEQVEHGVREERGAGGKS